MVLIVRGFLAVKPRSGRGQHGRLQLKLLRLRLRSAGRGRREKPRMGTARERLRSGDLTIYSGSKGSALQGRSDGG